MTFLTSCSSLPITISLWNSLPSPPDIKTEKNSTFIYTSHLFHELAFDCSWHLLALDFLFIGVLVAVNSLKQVWTKGYCNINSKTRLQICITLGEQIENIPTWLPNVEHPNSGNQQRSRPLLWLKVGDRSCSISFHSTTTLFVSVYTIMMITFKTVFVIIFEIFPEWRLFTECTIHNC